MPAITSLDLSNAKLDVDHIAAIANSQQQTATDRLGHTKLTVLGAVTTLKAFNPRGARVNGATYSLKDLYTEGGYAYVTVVNSFTSVSVSSDLAAGNVTIHQGATWEDLSNVNAASRVGFHQADLLASSQTVEDKLRLFSTPEDFIGDTATAIETALSINPYLKLRAKEYIINRDITHTGPVFIDATGATLKGDGVSINFINAAGSSWIGGELNNIVTPWTIVRDTTTWSNQTSSDVTISNLGYMPGPLDDDIYPGLTTLQKNQVAGIKLVFSSTTNTPQSGIKVQGVRGRFANIIFEGCINTTVSDIDIKGGKDYAAIVFYNDVSISRISQAALGYSFARGYNNRVYSSTINGSSVCGVTFFGNDYWYLEGVHAIGTGESGFKTYQKDATFGSSVICRYGKGVNISGIDNRFDGIDLSATFPTTGTESGHNILIGVLSKNNRATGVFSDAQSNQYYNIQSVDNGLGGVTVQAANLKLSGIYLENNTRKHGILGPINSYDLEVDGDNCDVSNVTIIRALPAPSVHAYFHGGSGGSSRFITGVGLSFLIAPTNLRGISNDEYRKTRVPSSFAQYYSTGETASIQSVIKLCREASEGVAVQLLQGPSETAVGSIAVTATSTVYNTTSDPRLKYNFKPLTGSGAFFDALKPYTFQWKINDMEDVGFDASKHQKVAKRSVTGAPDAVDVEGKPVYQGVAYASAEWVTYATAEIQDMRRRIAALESK